MHRCLATGTLVALIALFCLPAPAATTPPHAIAVQGSAQLDVMPDRAEITFGAVATETKLDDAMAQNRILTDKIVAALAKIGIRDTSVHTKDFGIEPLYEKNTGEGAWRNDTRREIAGYRVTNTLTVATPDLKLAARILDTGTRAGANGETRVNFTLVDIKPAFDKTYAAAVADARHKAEILATAAGLKLGKALAVTDNNADRSYFDGNNENAVRSLASKFVSAPQVTRLNPEPVRITAYVTILFAAE